MKSSKYSEISFILQLKDLSAAHKSVISKNYNDPDDISILIEDDRYWINGFGSGKWENQDFNIAIYLGNGNWDFEKVDLGDLAYVEDQDVHVYFDGTTLQEYASGSLVNHASTHEPGGSDQISQFDGGIF